MRHERLTEVVENKNQFISNENNFEPETKELAIDNDSLVFMFIGTEMLLIDGTVPLYKNIEIAESEIKYLKYIGMINRSKCFVMEIIPAGTMANAGTLFALRALYSLLPQPQMKAAIFGSQVVLWNRRTKYCGQCGSITEERLPAVLVKYCPECKEEFYPKISPSVIVAVINGDKILMAQHKRITNGMYTVLAGFVNPGETLEECVQREVKEEAGIEVKNIKYFGSQPWPFPDSLMIGFVADYAGGKVEPDNDEITDLKWFKAEEIPEWPSKVSIARSLIDYFIESNK